MRRRFLAFKSIALVIIFLMFGCKQNKQASVSNYHSELEKLITQEDTDGDKKITIEDKGPRCFEFVNSDGEKYKVEGVYHLSNLLQELAITKGDQAIAIERIKELPSDRISRLIKTRFWDNLTRSIDKEGLKKVLEDSKANSDVLRLYIPFQDTVAARYFKTLENDIPKLEVIVLPEEITPDYVKNLNSKPGILNLASKINDIGAYFGTPFVVPGGRFNEMYGWDSYFESVGLLIDKRADLAMAMADNFGYQIKHYGKILNANRSYYLTRTQPPFFSSLIKEIYLNNPNVSKPWLSGNLKMVIQEYETVWMKENVRLTNTGLNRFYGEGIGIPPETEEGHFDFILEKYAKKHKLNLEDFTNQYNSGELRDPGLDEYFTHDRSMRESGHDTSNRLDAICAELNTVGLNSLLYKYEVDIAYLIKNVFNNSFVINDTRYDSEFWLKKAERRKKIMNTLMWNEQKGSFYDYNFVTKKRTEVSSVTNFYPLWAGICTKEQSETLRKKLFNTLVQKGGIAGTSDIFNKDDPNAPQRQWDYPNGWAPHQMIIWRGLQNYGYTKETQELVYRWLWMITRNAVDYNGTIPEKYDVVKCTHKVYAEYGNVGTEFDYITPSGFGWMNASYQLGLSLLSKDLKNKLDHLVDPDEIFKKINK
ncbi:trehalase family glycosidase [Aquimarina sp. 2201CG5-10]|uniref:trehalase family glycosidase n=1 Tax=Aquimarina callyspongiae TaxID=3098150 RepID=UPI002AB4EB66|nr:trehalase family glycosidase [Aquimarina sp. 2201CG5-10]MDY8136708.1 trehalase family glycosidase [Aquimarina sp. 2201CG5-10]